MLYPSITTIISLFCLGIHAGRLMICYNEGGSNCEKYDNARTTCYSFAGGDPEHTVNFVGPGPGVRCQLFETQYCAHEGGRHSEYGVEWPGVDLSYNPPYFENWWGKVRSIMCWNV
ncbi:hypothetical protein EJ08DRAFT_223951 [Tothia fuscella]|uniref:Uncharacterized protein n=1 Tax=Tothia fuscella TaxID=1048955 RepID=A0A9P4P2H5_9PEZI|nr:hypothetical protein EJ08DRAFT_223951 [Tothia fuscella]